MVTRKIAYEVLGMVPGTMQVLDTGAGKVQSKGAQVRLGVTTYGVAWAGVTTSDGYEGWMR